MTRIMTEQTPTAEAEFVVYCDDEFAAGTSGPREHAWSEAMHYATVYSQDGTIKIEEVTRRAIPWPLATPTTPKADDIAEGTRQWKVEPSILDGFEAAITIDTSASIGNIAHVRRLVDAELIVKALAADSPITEEWLADVLQDSLEMDWTSADGARAIMKALASLPASQPVADVGDTVAFVQGWLMSGDYKPDQWTKDFAAAIDARSATLTARVGVLEGALGDLADLADRMPKKTPAAGSCVTEHQFTIEAGVIWALDLSVGRARAALASDPACKSGEVG